MKHHWQVTKLLPFRKLFTEKQLTTFSYYYHRLCNKIIDRYEVDAPKVPYKFTQTKSNELRDDLYKTTGLSTDLSDIVDLDKSFGNYFCDADGYQIMDLSMNEGFNVLGYNPRPVVSKTKLQGFQQYSVNSFKETQSLDYVDLLKEFNKLAPLDCENFQFTSNDNKAIEEAVQMAIISYSLENNLSEDNKFTILTLEGGNYQTNAVSVSFPELEFPYAQNQESNLKAEKKSIENFKNTIKQVRERGELVPAFVVEPIQYKAGVRFASPMFYRQLQEICLKENIKFIIDETYTCGWVTGRSFTHLYWCSEHAPDITVFGGRMQVSGFFHKRDLIDMDLLEEKNMSFKFNAKPDLAKLEYLFLLKHDVYKKDWLDLHCSDFFSSVYTELNDIKNKSHIELKNIRGMGKMFAFDVQHKLVRDELIYRARTSGFKITGVGEKTVVFTPSLLFTEVHFTFFKEFLASFNPTSIYLNNCLNI